MIHTFGLKLPLARRDERIAIHVRDDAKAKTAAQRHGIGPVTASALVVTVGDFGELTNAPGSSAPGSDGCRARTPPAARRLGRITKHGDDDLRTPLIRSGKSAVICAAKRGDRLSRWLVQLKERVGWQKAVVALANKNARILWAVLTRESRFDPDHVPVRPQPTTAAA